MSSARGLATLGAHLDSFLGAHGDELIHLRRDLHAHPELAREERRTTALLAERLSAAGLAPTLLPGGAGLWCDIGTGDAAVALRADIDALPIDDLKAEAPYRSTVPGVCHACGHDVHAAVVLGAGLALAQLHRVRRLPGRVRLIFEPAEEANPGGALDVIAAGGLEGVTEVFALHCDPRLDVGQVGLRAGHITGSSDHLHVHFSSAGGHTARPHLTGDLVYALAKVVTDVPALLSRRVDPRAGLSVVWGHVSAGESANVIPQQGLAVGTVRSLDTQAWKEARQEVTQAVLSLGAPYGVHVEVDYRRGVPPVVNDAESVETFRQAVGAVLGAGQEREVEQSLGGEDFAWFLEHARGALARLGVRSPGSTGVGDLHQGSFDADEHAIGVGVRLLTATALLALTRSRGRSTHPVTATPERAPGSASPPESTSHVTRATSTAHRR